MSAKYYAVIKSNVRNYRLNVVLLLGFLSVVVQSDGGCNAVNSPQYVKGTWGSASVGTQVFVPDLLKTKINDALKKVPKLNLEVKEANATYKTGQRTCSYGDSTSMDTYNEVSCKLKTTKVKIPLYGVIFSKSVTVPTIFGDIDLVASGGAGVTFNTEISLDAKGGRTVAGCTNCEWIYGGVEGSVTAELEAYAGLDAGYEKKDGSTNDFVNVGGSLLKGGLVFSAGLEYNTRSEPSGFSGSASVSSIYAETEFNLFWLDPEVHVDFYPTLGGSITCGDYEFVFSSGEVSVGVEA